MLKLKKVSEIYNLKVYTDDADYFGDVEEAIVSQNKISGWRVRATKNSFLSNILGNAKGVIIPHRLVKSIGDIVIVSKNAVPNYGSAPDDEESQEQQ